MNTNILKALTAGIGLDDGEGNTSSMRLFVLLVLLAVIIPKVAAAIKTGVPPVWTGDDMAIISIAFGAKVVQKHQETSTTDKQTTKEQTP